MFAYDPQGFFSKFLMGRLKILTDGNEVWWGGGDLWNKIQLKPKLPT